MDEDSIEWKKSLLLLHRKANPKFAPPPSYGKENNIEEDRDGTSSKLTTKQHSVRSGRGLKSFDTTPKHKYSASQPLLRANYTATLWDNSFFQPTPIKSDIVDYFPAQPNDDVILHTPERSDPSDTSNMSNNESNIANDTSDVIQPKALDFSMDQTTPEKPSTAHSIKPLHVKTPQTARPVSPTRSKQEAEFSQLIEQVGQLQTACDKLAASRTPDRIKRRPSATPPANTTTKNTASTGPPADAPILLFSPARTEKPSQIPKYQPPSHSRTPQTKPRSHSASQLTTPSDFPETVKAPEKTPQVMEGLGDEFKEATTSEGKKYYYNRRTRESHWKLPSNAVFVYTSDTSYRIFVKNSATVSQPTPEKQKNADTPLTTASKKRDKPVASTTPLQHNQTPQRPDTNATDSTHDSSDISSLHIIDSQEQMSDVMPFTQALPDALEACVTLPDVNKRLFDSDERISAIHCPMCGVKCQSNISAHIEQCYSSHQHMTPLLTILSNALLLLPTEVPEERPESSPAIIRKNHPAAIKEESLPRSYSELYSAKQPAKNMTLATTTVKATRKTDSPNNSSKPIVSPLKRIVTHHGMYVCPTCNESSFQTREVLLRHMRSCLSADATIAAPLTSDTFPGNAQAKSVCPFCGKPTIPSSISSHLLVCKQKKQIQQNRLGETLPEKKRGSSAPITRPKPSERRVQSAVSRLAATKHV